MKVLKLQTLAILKNTQDKLQIKKKKIYIYIYIYIHRKLWC